MQSKGKPSSKDKVCDQYNKSYSRCNRQKPVCESCLKSNKKCTWDRKPNFRTNQVYQNIETFSNEEKFKPVQRSNNQLIFYSKSYSLSDKIGNKLCTNGLAPLIVAFSLIILLKSQVSHLILLIKSLSLNNVLLNKIRVNSIKKKESIASQHNFFDVINKVTMQKKHFSIISIHFILFY